MTVVSVRSFLAAGLTAAAVGAVAVTPLPTSAGVSVPIASPAFALSAAVADVVVDPQAIVPTASNPITNAYDRLEPWAAYGAELAQWALSWIPGLWWVAPGVDFAYYSIEPLVQAGVYSLSYVLFAQFGDQQRHRAVGRQLPAVRLPVDRQPGTPAATAPAPAAAAGRRRRAGLAGPARCRRRPAVGARNRGGDGHGGARHRGPGDRGHPGRGAGARVTGDATAHRRRPRTVRGGGDGGQGPRRGARGPHRRPRPGRRGRGAGDRPGEHPRSRGCRRR